MRMKLFFTILILTAAALVTTAMPGYAALVSYWDFEDGSGSATADDESAGSNIGTLTGMNTTTDWVDGKVGEGALNFNGTSGYVKVPDDDSLDITGSLTISSWVRFDTLTPLGVVDGLVSKWKNDTGNMVTYMMAIYNPGTITDDFRLELVYLIGPFPPETGGDYANMRAFSGSCSLSASEWYHFAVVHDTDTSSDHIYINGQELTVTTYRNSGPKAYANPIRATDAWIGIGGIGANYVDGAMDDVRIYNEALSQSQIQALTNLGSSVPEPGTVAGVAALVAMGMRRIRRNKNVKSV